MAGKNLGERATGYSVVKARSGSMGHRRQNVMSPSVHIIILSYNGRRWLDPCLASVSATEYSNFKIILVDNASNDDSAESVRRQYPQVTVILNNHNYGFSEGNNIGIRSALSAGADYVVLLNQDTRVTPQWLGELISVGEGDERIGILGAVQLNYDNDDFNSWTTSVMRDYLAEMKNPTPPPARSWIPVEWVEGACFAIKREVLEKIGLLDPIYFAFYEEIDLCRRASYHGFSVALVPRSRIHHYRGGSWQENRKLERERNYRCDRSQFIYNLTDPRKSLAGNLLSYLITLRTKSREILVDFDWARARDLLSIQFDVLANCGKLFGKWRRERSPLHKGLIA
jgi:GT2 family glycosyltransferase